MTVNPEFKKLLDEMLAIHDMKNSDYAEKGDPYKNFRECEKFGVPASKGILIRMSDKWSRICNLSQKDEPAVKDESIEDTLKDLANYCLLYILVRREEKEKLCYKDDCEWSE